MSPRRTRKAGHAPRRRPAKSAFDAIALEGGLLQPDLFAAIAAGQSSEQGESDYGLDPKEKLRDVVQTKFTLAQSLHVRLLGSDKGPAATRRFLTGLFTQVFEFADLAESRTTTIGERSFPIGQQALGGRAPIVFAPHGKLEEALPGFSDGHRRRSGPQLLQEYLNAFDAALWGLICDGARLRLYRDSASLTRPAYIEADLARIFDADAPLIADFAALWLLVHVSRFGKPGTPPSDCALERWREEGRKQGATARERLRDGVEQTLLTLGRGFLEHPANEKLRTELASGKLSPQDYLQALLRLVYRFIFVFTAEDRDVLHAPEPENIDPNFQHVIPTSSIVIPAPAGTQAPHVHAAKDSSSRADARSLGPRFRGDDTDSNDAEKERWRMAKSLYARGYAFARLRERAAKRTSRDRHGDGWEGVQIVFRALARGEPRLALPALGGLFAPNGARELGDCALANTRLYEALFHLSWIATGAGIERVNWRDMETEELGSVYESLLELVPRLGGADSFAFVEARGNERKTTASYYTPDSLVQALLDETLDPLIEETIKNKSPAAAAEALLSLRIIDPACGSAHFLLAAARRLAAKISQLMSPAAPSPAEFRHWLREAARRCLFGVDRNPMAVDLAKVALWIETVEPGKPLTFLDAHIRCGDALLGIYDLAALHKGIPDDAYKPLTGDDKAAAREWGRRNRAERDACTRGQFSFSEPPRTFRDAVLAMESQAEDALSDVQAKAQAFHALLATPERYNFEVACNLYMAAFLLPKIAPPGRLAGEAQSFIPTSRDLWDVLGGGKRIHPRVEAHAVDAAKLARVLHWPLEFPQVFFPPEATPADLAAHARNAKAGFDLAIGNPPWERIKLQEQEFFAARAPEIADAPNKAARQRMIDTLERATADTAERRLYDSFVLAKRIAEAASVFARTAEEAGGRFPLSGTGDVNTYALFAELFSRCAAYAGAIVPTGVATDATTAAFFSSLVARGRVKAVIDFENRAGLFPAIDSRMKFCILALAKDIAAPQFAFFLTDPLQRRDERRRFTLTAEEIALINPNTRTAPIFRSKADAELTCRIYERVPVLIDESKVAAGDPWGIEFARLFDMSNDSSLFRTARQLESAGAVRDGAGWEAPKSAPHLAHGRYVPLYEAKMIHHYDPRWATYKAVDGGDIEPRDVTQAEKSDPDFDPAPRYFVPEREVLLRLSSLPKGFLDAMRAGDEKLIALFLAFALFGQRLSRAGYPGKRADDWNLFGEWQAFVAHHRALRIVTPANLGLVGDNPPLMEPANGNCLPATPIDEIVSTERERTAWHEVDPQALESVLKTVVGYSWAVEPENPLLTIADVITFAEKLLNTSCPDWLMGWRDITNATNERTVIGTAFPRCAVGNNLPVWFTRSGVDPIYHGGFLAVLSSLVLDFAARQKVGGTHLNFFIAQQIPVLAPSMLSRDDLSFIVPRVLELTYTSHSMRPFAENLGYSGAPFAWNEERRALLRAELDAKIAALYGLTRDQLRYILDPEDVMGKGYPSETFRVLKKNEITRYRDYRTARLVLDAWDRLERGELE